jgi:hypothetical protein
MTTPGVTGTVTSADRTTIGYYSLGRGQGLVLRLAAAPGHREPRERRGRQTPAPVRRQGSRRASQDTPYSPNARLTAVGLEATATRVLASAISLASDVDLVPIARALEGGRVRERRPLSRGVAD